MAIDPLYAPALLTVGSIEYQLDREEEGFELLMRLTTLPEDDPDLHVIIDKAGDCMLDEDDVEGALKGNVAEGVGFEPTETFASAVFKTAKKLCTTLHSVAAEHVPFMRIRTYLYHFAWFFRKV